MHTAQHTLPLLLILLATTLQLACNDDLQRDTADLRRQLLVDLGDNVIMPLHRDLEGQSQSMAQSAALFCSSDSSITPQTLESLRQEWHNTRRTWKHLEAFDYGPATEQPTRYGARIDFWPARTDTLQEALQTPPSDLSNAPATIRGLPAIEFLLFGTQNPTTDEHITNFSPSSNHCIFLQAATADLALTTSDLRKSWDPNDGDFLGEITRAGQDSQTYETLEMALQEVVNRFGYICEDIRADKLNTPLGLKADGTPKPDLIESPYSNRSLDDIRDNLAVLHTAFYGTYTDRNGVTTSGFSFHAYTQRRNNDLAIPFDTAHQNALAAVDAVPPPLATAIVDHRDSVTNLSDPLRTLQSVIQVDLVDTLGIDVIFNDTDGD